MATNHNEFCDMFQEPEEDNFELRSLDFIGQPDFAISNTGEIWQISTNKRVKQYANPNGYLIAHFGGTSQRVHRLVAQAFVPNPNPSKYNIVDHLDCDPGNPNADNLRWTDTQGNLQHQVQVGSLPPMITPAVMHQICRDLQDGVGTTEIARKYGVSHDAVFQVKRGENWRHISKQYDIIPPKAHNPRLTEQQVIKVCELLNETSLTCGEIAKLFGTSADAIKKISSGTNWRHITQEHLLRLQNQDVAVSGENPPTESE